MDLSNFVEKAKELNVLGVKVSQNGELIGSGTASLSAGETFTRRRKALLPAPWVLQSRKDFSHWMKN